jgi:hypothetical protein
LTTACAGCGIDFIPTRPWQKYHSILCRDRAAKWRKRRDPDRVVLTRISKQRYYISNREQKLAQQKRNNRNIRAIVIKEYGGRCACCGEGNEKFLSIDHINNDGAEHKKKLFGSSRHGSSAALYRWLIKNGFPRDNFRLLCYNCNCGRQHNNGICPHEEER